MLNSICAFFFQYGSAETIFFDSTKVLLTDLKSVPDDVESVSSPVFIFRAAQHDR